MLKHALVTGAAVAVICLLAAGCQVSCDSVCEDQGGCPNAIGMNCQQSCAETEALNEASQCSGIYSDLLECADSIEDCNEGDNCANENAAWHACVDSYCAANPTTAGCPPATSP